MKLCIPAIGSMIRLTEDWTIKIDPQVDMWWSHSFACLKNCEKEPDHYHDFVIKKAQNITLPKDTILMIDNISMHKPVAKTRRHYARKDHASFSIVETSLEYEVDSKVIKTPTGRISKKKKKRPAISFHCSPEEFNKIEFEFTF